MERRLLEATRKGNIRELKDLIGSNELILEEMALKGAGHTPLHVACLGGHLDVVRELLKHMPKFAEKVDQDGFSPLHIAAARGDVEITRELLKERTHLCSVKGWDRRIPLHYAIINGEVDVMEILLSNSPESVEETTAREETALHLAVKNNRFKVLVQLVEHLKEHKKEEVINWRDHEGNTALHLAVASKNFEVVSFLLRGHALESGVVDVNSWNNSGLTPLDVSSPVQRGERDREITELLVRAGAKHRASRAISGDDADIEGGNGHQLDGKPVTNATQSLSCLQPKNSSTEKESLGEIRNDLLVVAALIASATYQSVLQPPDLSNDRPRLVYTLFLGGNTFGFLMSVQIIICLTKGLPVKLPLILSLIGMLLTYFSFTLSLMIKSTTDGTATDTVLHVMPLMIAVFLLLIQRFLAAVAHPFLNWLFKFHLLGEMYTLKTQQQSRGCK